MSIQPGVGYTFTSSGQGTNLNILTNWSEWAQPVLAETYRPLQVYDLRYESTGSTHFFKVYPGTVNNLVPQIEDDPSNWVKLDRVTAGVPDPPEGIITTSGGFFYIYLRTGPDATTDVYPSSDTTSSRYPRIIPSGTVLTDTDTEGYILLAHGSIDASNNVTLYQDLSGSVWSDRIKLGTLTAKYYYAAV